LIELSDNDIADLDLTAEGLEFGLSVLLVVLGLVFVAATVFAFASGTEGFVAVVTDGDFVAAVAFDVDAEGAALVGVAVGIVLGRFGADIDGMMFVRVDAVVGSEERLYLLEYS